MPILRDVTPALATALTGGVPLWSADLFRFVLADGVTIFHWTSWDVDLLANGFTYSSKKPWLTRSKWNVTNTMQVPSLVVKLQAQNVDFNNGANIKTQIHNGLLDGAAFLLSRAYMTTPGNTSALGTVDLFGGETAGIDLIGNLVNITIKGKVNKLDQYAPKNVTQKGCNHAFCDIGCTLNRVTFTTAFSVGTGPSLTFIPWTGTPPGNAVNYLGGSIQILTGMGAGQWRTVISADASGLGLSYPLYQLPAVGDDFNAFEGCDKTFDSGSGRSCTDRSNTQNFRGFEFVPPPTAAI